MNIGGEEVDHKYLPEAVPGEKVGFNFKDIPIKDIKRGYITSGVADFTFAPVDLCTEIKSMEKNNESLTEAARSLKINNHATGGWRTKGILGGPKSLETKKLGSLKG